MLLLLGPHIAPDAPPALAVAVHFETAEGRAAELERLPLERDARLRDVRDLEHRVGRGRRAVRLEDGLLERVKGLGALPLGLEVARDRDGENRTGSERRVVW